MSIGFTVPFSRSTGSLGYFETTQDEVSAVHENLKSLLLTNWGERLMHYSFGCNLSEFLFEQIHGEELKDSIRERIIHQVERWMPFVAVDDIDVVFEEDDSSIGSNTMFVVMKFRVASRPNLSETLSFELSPGRS